MPRDAALTILHAGRFPLSDQTFEPVYQAGFHALHLHGYTGTFRLHGEDHTLEPGCVTLSPAGEPTAYDLPKPGVHWCVHFTWAGVGRRGRKAEPADELGEVALPWCRMLGRRVPEAEARLRDLVRLRQLAESSDTDPAMTTRYRRAGEAMLSDLLRWLDVLDDLDRAHAGRPSRAVEDVIAFVDRHLDQPMTVPQLANHVGLSQRSLAKQFQQEQGVTLTRYILARRIEHAQLLLATTDAPVKRIAAQVGLPDPHHFNKQFRQLTGQSPTAARLGA